MVLLGSYSMGDSIGVDSTGVDSIGASAGSSTIALSIASYSYILISLVYLKKVVSNDLKG